MLNLLSQCYTLKESLASCHILHYIIQIKLTPIILISNTLLSIQYKIDKNISRKLVKEI